MGFISLSTYLAIILIFFKNVKTNELSFCLNELS